MIFYLDSKIFEKNFLRNESDNDILETQYVIVSTRIRISSSTTFENILNAKNDLFPSCEVCCALTDDDFRERYFKQLKENKYLISSLVQGSIKENFNICFICTKTEGKLKFLKYLAEFIIREFNYPVYDYSKYKDNKSVIQLLVNDSKNIDSNEVLRICKDNLQEAKERELDNMSDEDIIKTINKLSKDSLKKELKSRGLYKKGMDKTTMRELLEFDIL